MPTVGRGRKIEPERLPGLYASYLLGRSMAAIAREADVAPQTLCNSLRRFEREEAEEAERIRAAIDVSTVLDPGGVPRVPGACPAEPEVVYVRLCGGEVVKRWRCGACKRVLRAGQPEQCGRCGTIVRWPK